MEGEVPNKNVAIFILPNTLSKNYLDDIKKAALKNNFLIQDKFQLNSTRVVVSNIGDLQQLLKLFKIEKASETENEIIFVNLKWLIEGNKSGELPKCLDQKYFIGSTNPKTVTENSAKESKLNLLDDYVLANYECQRPTPLRHHNEEFTILEEYAMFKGTDIDMIRALSFRRAICSLKCLPIKITNIKQLKNIKKIGDHTLKVIEDILTYGISKEVDSITSQEYYTTVKLFNSIFGCGSMVSNRLFDSGLRSIESLRENFESLSIYGDHERFRYGLTYHDDLTSQPILKDECDNIFETLKRLILEHVNDKCLIELTGGFRRGKETGHDVDFLVTHPVLGEEKGLLAKIIETLENRNFLVYSRHDKESSHDWTKKSSNNIMDHFERFISILKFPIFQKSPTKSNDSHGLSTNKRLKLDSSESELVTKSVLNDILKSMDASKFKRNWIARRVDIIICPINQFPFALLGWIGSKHFNRSIRLYADKEFGYRLSSHGLYDYKNVIYSEVLIEAKTEQDIFNALKLKYLEPHERNC